MDDTHKTKVELLEELVELRRQVAELQAREVSYRQTGETLPNGKKNTETLINSSLDMIISVDPERKITEFNAAAEQTFGYRRAEVLGQLVDLLYADPAQGWRVHTETLQQGRFTGEVMNRRKDGQVFCSYLSAAPMRNT